MRVVFDLFDSTGDGTIQPSEIGTTLRELNLIKSRRQIQAIVEVVDVNGDGEIDFEEFVALMGRVQEEAETAPEDPAALEATEEELEAAAQQAKEERQAKMERQAALQAFQRAVTVLAFTELAKDDEKLMAELLDVLRTDPAQRSEWDLQRLLMWAENYDPAKKGVDVGFKFILSLPPPEESNVRIEVCRCMTVQQFDEGQTICKQGETGDCMYVIMVGEVDVLIANEGKEELVASMGPGRSVGELAVIGEDESDTLRTATLRAHVPCVLGVLSRADYRRHILRMEQEAKGELVDKLVKVEYLRRIGRAGLLRMAMMMKPVRFSRGEEICRQGVVPETVTFLTSGSAMVTVHVDDGRPSARSSKRVEVMEQGFNTSAVGIGVSIAGDDPELNRWGLRATTVCEGVCVSINVAKRVLNKRHVQESYKEHVIVVDRMIARRVAESGAGDRARESLGFPSDVRRTNAGGGRRSGRHSYISPAVSGSPSRLFGVPTLRGPNVTPRSLLAPDQTENSPLRPMPPSGALKAGPMPPLRLVGGAARPAGGQTPRGSPRQRATLGHASPRSHRRESPAHRAAIATPRMPVSTHGPHAARVRILGTATTG